MGQEMIKESQEPLETVDPSESVPDGEVLVADKEEFNWKPLENQKIISYLNKLGTALVGIKNVTAYRNPGKSDYTGFRISKMKGVCFIYTSVKSARVSCGEVITDENGKSKGSFPKNLIFRVGEEGITREGKKVKISEIISHVKRYIKDRGW